jgi:hypothetical protein
MNVKQISINYLTEMLAVSKIVDTINTGGLLSHTIQHPTLGNLITVQGSGDDCLLISRK